MSPRVKLAHHPSVREELAKAIVHETIEANRRVILEHQKLQAEKKVAVADAEPTDLPICIVGAGCAGLYTAMILDTLNIPYEILEASDRIGGRVYTHRFNGKDGQDADVNDPARYDYIDMGAMRYPNIDFMKRVFDLFSKLKMDQDKLLIQYKYSVDNTFELYNGIRYNTSDNWPEKDIFQVSEGKGGAVPNHYVDEGADEVAKGIFKPFADDFNNPNIPFKDAWRRLTKYDPFSTRGYLLSEKYPESVVEWLETFQTATGLYNDAFVESTMDAMDFGTPAPTKEGGIRGEDLDYDWYCIDGGSDHLTTRMEGSLETKPRTGVRVTKIASAPERDFMEVEFQTRDGKTEKKPYSQVICTVPLGCLAAIEIPAKDLSYMKRMAIRSLNYDTSTKVALKFESRWWEDPAVMGDRTIVGGISSTDLPIRTCVYPSYGLTATGKVPGVLLASYMWAQDAQRLGGLAQAKGSEADKLLVDLTLRNLSELHDVPIEKFGPLLDHYVVNWHNDENARGAFALFGPGQFGDPSRGTSMFASLEAPAAHGRLHIAGEATSVHHAWVLGALNSAWRAVYNALGMFGEEAEAKRKLLEKEWGVPTEMDKVALDDLAILGDAQVF